MCEEMKYASKDAPKAIVGSVIIGFVVWNASQMLLILDRLTFHPRTALLHSRHRKCRQLHYWSSPYPDHTRFYSELCRNLYPHDSFLDHCFQRFECSSHRSKSLLIIVSL